MVFSLIILRKLSPLDAFDTGGSLYEQRERAPVQIS